MIGQSTPPLRERLAAYVHELDYGRLPAIAVARVKDVIVHDLVVGIAGSESDEGIGAVALIESDFGSAGPSTVLRRARTASPIDAAFANAVMMRALRQEDSLTQSGIHAGVLTIPVAVALAEQLGRDGREVISAIVAGYDVAAALDACSPDTRAARTSSHVYGAFAAASTAAKLMRLDLDQTAIAIAHAGNLGAMINAGFGDHQYGILVRNGMTAAYLGRARAPAPRDAIEGDPGFFAAQVGKIPDDFSPVGAIGERHAVLDAALKPYPGAHTNSVAITLAKQLVARHRLRADDISRVVVHRRAESNDALKLSKGPFASRSDATSSVPFAVAAVLLDGDYTGDRLDRYNDAESLRVAQRVDVDTAVEGSLFFHRVDIHLHDGTVHSAEGDERVVDATDPMKIARFHRSTAIDERGARAIRAAVEKLETFASIVELTTLLR